MQCGQCDRRKVLERGNISLTLSNWMAGGAAALYFYSLWSRGLNVKTLSSLPHFTLTTIWTMNGTSIQLELYKRTLKISLQLDLDVTAFQHVHI